MTDASAVLEETIDIDASPATVWSLVTDLPRMAQWSPQVVRTIVRGDGIKLGTRLLQRREAPDGTTKLSTTMVKAFLGGQQSFQLELRGGMKHTLARIKIDAERAVPTR